MMRKFSAMALAAMTVAGAGQLTWAASASAATTVPECSAANLATWVSADQGDGAAGSVYYPLEFTNISGESCSLEGFPQVSAVDSTGRQLGDAASPSRSFTPKKVVLAAGATAHAVLQWSDAAVYTSGCKPEAATVLKVVVPGQHDARYAMFDLDSCRLTGTVYLLVQPIQPGV